MYAVWVKYSVLTFSGDLSCFPVGGRDAMVKLSGSSRSRIFDSFMRLSNFFFATFSACFLFIDVWKGGKGDTEN